MKKIISLLLVLVMLSITCFSLVSCGDEVSAKTIEDNAFVAMSEAQERSVERFIGNKDLTDIINEMVAAKGVTVSYNDETGKLSPIKNAEIFIGTNGDREAAVLSLTLGELAITGNIFSSKDGIIVSGEDIVGSDKALMINYSTIMSDLKGSALATILGLTGEMIDEVLNSIKGTVEQLKGEVNIDIEALMNEIISKLGLTVTDEEVNGAKCVVVTLTINNDAAKDIVDIIGREIKKLMPEEESETIDEALANVYRTLEQTTISITEKTAITKKEGYLISRNATGTVTTKDENGEDDVTTLTSSLDFLEDEIKSSIKYESENDVMSLAFNVKRTFEDGKLSIVSSLKVTEEDETQEPIKATFVYDTADGNISLNATVALDDSEAAPVAVTVNGSFKSEGGKHTLKISSFKSGAITVDLDVAITFENEPTIPAAPENALDITKITAEQWQTVITEITSSKLFTLISALVPQQQ